MNDTSLSLTTNKNEISMLSEDVMSILKQRNIDGNLDLSNNDIGDNAMPELCEQIIKLGDKVNKLDLDGTNITSKGASVLLERLKESKLIVTSLSLSRNDINDSFMTQIGEYLQNNQYLERLTMESASITDKGIEILSKYLVGNVGLKQLGFGLNDKITNVSILLLVEMIESSHINELFTQYTSIFESRILALPLAHNAIRYESSRLNLSMMQVNDNDVVNICEIMKKYELDKLKEV